MSSSIEISETPSKKARKTDPGVEDDHISNLPNCVISHILSRLPMKDAVKTSVLLKDWEYKWTSIHDVELDDGKACENVSSNATFVKFVERILHLSQNLQSFRLSCSKKYDSDCIKTWISITLSRGVHSLELSYCYGAGLVLPPNLLNCYSLRELVVGSSCILKVPTAIGLPNLTKLWLNKVEILNEVSNSDLVKFNFPVLETFILVKCKLLNVKFVEIYAPKMTSFTFWNPYNYGGVNVDYSIKIIGDSLVSFKHYGGLQENINVLSGSPEAYTAHLETNFGRGNIGVHLLVKSGLQIRKLLKRFSSSLEDLNLSCFAGKAFALSKLRLSLPVYYKMERLGLVFIVNNEALFELLHAAPLLKFLVIDGFANWNDDYDYDAEEYILSCIVSQLEEVKFGSFEMNVFKLAKFFLKNAGKLKSLSVFSRKIRDEIKQELWTFPRASSCLDVVFT